MRLGPNAVEIAEVHLDRIDADLGARHLRADGERDPLVGWMRMASTFGSLAARPVLRKIECGAGLNTIAISVTRLGRRLPARR